MSCRQLCNEIIAIAFDSALYLKRIFRIGRINGADCFYYVFRRNRLYAGCGFLLM